MRKLSLTVLALALTFTVLPASATPPEAAPQGAVAAETLIFALPTADMTPAAETGACGDEQLFSAEATSEGGFTAPLQGGPCTGVSCTSHYECQQYCGAAGGRCGFPDCEPNTCYCFF